MQEIAERIATALEGIDSTLPWIAGALIMWASCIIIAFVGIVAITVWEDRQRAKTYRLINGCPTQETARR